MRLRAFSYQKLSQTWEGIFSYFDCENWSALGNKYKTNKMMNNFRSFKKRVRKLQWLGYKDLVLEKVMKWLFSSTLNCNMAIASVLHLMLEKRIILQKESGKTSVCWIKYELKKFINSERFAHENSLNTYTEYITTHYLN